MKIERRDELLEIAAKKGISEERFNRIYEALLIPDLKNGAAGGASDGYSPPDTPKAAKPKATTKKVAAPKKAKTARKPNAAFMKPLNPSKELSEIVGAAALPRTEVMKKVWAYIKKNNLQDAKNRRAINADDKLKAVFGGKKQVTMFEMTKLVSNHLQKPRSSFPKTLLSESQIFKTLFL